MRVRSTRKFSLRHSSHCASLLQENNSVTELREKIKTFLASQGMIKGHSGSGPRSTDGDPPVLVLVEALQTSNPSTPTLSQPPLDGSYRPQGLPPTMREGHYHPHSMPPPPEHYTTAPPSMFPLMFHYPLGSNILQAGTLTFQS